MSNVVFLLGAGVSIPAGMPSTSDITQCVMSGERVVGTRREHAVRTGKDSYRFSASPTVYQSTDDHVPSIIRLLSILREFLQGTYGDLNYEEIFYALKLCIDGKEEIKRDPAPKHFWRRISARMEGKLVIAPEVLLDLLYEAEAYIYHVVWEMLETAQSTLDHLKCVIDGYRDQCTSNMTIATLNHDKIVEQALRSNGLGYVDGFGASDGAERHWCPRIFDEPGRDVVLLKLHGSLDWIEYRDHENNVKKIIAADCGMSHPDSGNADRLTDTSPSYVASLRDDPRFLNVRAYPWVLVGTYNKQSSDTRPPFCHLHYRFTHALQHSSRLVIAGVAYP
jgi:hypothetical protein